MSDETTKKELQSVDTNTMPWGELYIEQLKVGIPVKELILADGIRELSARMALRYNR